ncbi:MAG: hypothetical protein ACKOBT_03890, partial [Actinomycetota bacterium]
MGSNRSNRRIVLARRPQGRPQPSDFAFLDDDALAVEEGQVVVAVDHLGIDAFIRTTLEEESFHQGAQIG